MVTTASGAGSLSISGSIDTSMIERGFTRVKQGFESVKGHAKGFNADLERMSISAGRLTKGLLAVGIAGTTAMVGLASKAPATAGAMAKIKVQMDRLTRSIGRTLQPQFEWFAEIFTKFVNFAEGHPTIFKGFIAATAAIGAATAIQGAAKLAGLLGITVSSSLLTALGLIAVIAGVGYGAAKVGEMGANKLDKWLGLTDSPVSEKQMTAGGYATLLQEEIKSGITGKPSPGDIIREKDRITAAGFVPTPGGTMTAREEDRRWMLLTWWDAIWS